MEPWRPRAVSQRSIESACSRAARTDRRRRRRGRASRRCCSRRKVSSDRTRRCPPTSSACCHPTLKHGEDEGHYRKDGGPDLDPVEVVLAAGGVWNRAEATCSTGCHAPPAESGDAKATHQRPVWTRVGEDQAKCGTCHGN